jgi:hypothetical protein
MGFCLLSLYKYGLWAKPVLHVCWEDSRAAVTAPNSCGIFYSSGIFEVSRKFGEL